MNLDLSFLFLLFIWDFFLFLRGLETVNGDGIHSYDYLLYLFIYLMLNSLENLNQIPTYS